MSSVDGRAHAGAQSCAPRAFLRWAGSSDFELGTTFETGPASSFIEFSTPSGNRVVHSLERNLICENSASIVCFGGKEATLSMVLAN